MSIQISEDGYIDHKFITNETIEARDYQFELANSGLEKSTLIALPTGTGKTIVSTLISAERLSRTNSSVKILVLAPTKPLVEQHYDSYVEFLDIADTEFTILTGDTQPDERAELWDRKSVILATPQVIENDLIASRISLDDVTHITFDECHRATGDYSYTYIADMYEDQADEKLVTALSASPGSDEEEILSVCENLYIENVKVITEENENLQKHLSETTVQTDKKTLDGDHAEIRDLIDEDYTDVLKKLKSLGVIDTRDKSKVNKLTFINAQSEANELIKEDDSKGYKAKSFLAEGRMFAEAITAVESKGLSELEKKFNNWQSEADAGQSKAVQRFLKRPNVAKAKSKTLSSSEPHPKLKTTRSEVILEVSQGNKVLIFTQSRQMASHIAEYLTMDKVTAKRFVGQTDKEGDEGLSQEEQSQRIQEFRDGDIDVLVATSVAEEGLDIPAVDLVIFYEPVSSTIRTVQRRGRTGREESGRVLILMTRNSRDEGAYYKTKREENTLNEDLKKLRDNEDYLNENLHTEQADLTEFEDTETVDVDTDVDADEMIDAQDETSDESTVETIESSDSVTIVSDTREMKSTIVRGLSKKPLVNLETEQLEVGDYIVSSDCAVERKSIEDFISTLTGNDNRQLFEQIASLVQNYDKQVLILEGNQEELFTSGVHPNAIRGALAAIELDFGVAIHYTRDEDDTVEYLQTIAEKEQTESDTVINPHASKATGSFEEQQIYVVSSITDVGPVTAEKLLEELGTVSNVFTADSKTLCSVDGVGEKTAERIREIAEKEF